MYYNIVTLKQGRKYISMITAIIWFLFTTIFLGTLALLCKWAENTKLGYIFVRSVSKVFFDTDLDELKD